MYFDLQHISGNMAICSGNIPLSAASCIYLYSKKCVANLEMCEICVNTHTHIATGVSSRVNILIFIDIHKGGNSCKKEFPPFFIFVYPILTH